MQEWRKPGRDRLLLLGSQLAAPFSRRAVADMAAMNLRHLVVEVDCGIALDALRRQRLDPRGERPDRVGGVAREDARPRIGVDCG